MHKNLSATGPLCCQVLIKPSNNCQIVEHLPKWRIFAKSGHTAIEPLPIPTVLDCPNSLYDYITFSQYSLHLSLSIGPLISYTHTHPHTHTPTHPHTSTHTHTHLPTHPHTHPPTHTHTHTPPHTPPPTLAFITQRVKPFTLSPPCFLSPFIGINYWREYLLDGSKPSSPTIYHAYQWFSAWFGLAGGEGG